MARPRMTDEEFQREMDRITPYVAAELEVRRPVIRREPWRAEGCSKATYYRRRAKKRRETERD